MVNYIVTILIYLIVIFTLIIWILLGRYLLIQKDDLKYSKSFTWANFKAGDILMVSYNCSWAPSLFTGTIWNHSALLCNDPSTGNLMVLEGCNYYDKEGFISLSLQEWYYKNRNCRICHIPLNKAADSRLIWNAFEPFRKYSLLGFNPKIYRFLLNRNFYTFNDLDYKYRVCFEATIHCLQMAEIFKPIKTCSSYWPSALLYRTIPTYDSYYYLDPYEVSLSYEYLQLDN